MRREGAALPWISMLDLLFGLFGALVVLTAIISLKLGGSDGTDDTPFALMTIELNTTADLSKTPALQQMRLGFLIEHDGRIECRLEAPKRTGTCPWAKMQIGRTANGIIASAFFSPESPERIGVTPILTEADSVLDVDLPPSSFDVNLIVHIKSANIIWEPVPVKLDLTDLLTELIEKQWTGSAIPLLEQIPCTGNDICKNGGFDDNRKAIFFRP